MTIIKKEEVSLEDLMSSLVERDAAAASSPVEESTEELTTAPTTEVPATGEGEEEEEYATTEIPDIEEEVESPGNQQMAELLEMVHAQQRLLQQHGIVPGNKTETPAPILDMTRYILSDDELDKVIDHPEIFNTKLKAMVTDFNALLVATPQSMAGHIETTVANFLWAKEQAETFYRDNKDLATPTIKGLIQTTFERKRNEIISSGRSFDFQRVLQQVGTEVRRDLGLRKVKNVQDERQVKGGKQDLRTSGKGSQQPVPPAKKQRPTLPGATAGKKTAPSPRKDGGTSQQSLMAELLG